MSFAKFASAASGSLSHKSSQELPKEIAKPLNGDQDYVLVDEGDETAESSKAGGGERAPHLDSPLPVEVELEAPPMDESDLKDLSKPFKLDTEALAVWRERHSSGRANSVNTDRTDYSGLNEHPANSVSEKEQVVHKALEEANQQHQWAMEAVIRGWESEKSELLQKLRKMTEARDTLEAELKHSENNFAGMMEGMLDQKLDQMLIMLQDSATNPPSARSALSSPSTAASQPRVQKAQKVVHDLGSMLENLKLQQAAVEARVSTMQSAVMQLLPEGGSAETDRTVSEFRPRFSDSGLVSPQYALPSAFSEPPEQRPQSFLRRSVCGVGKVCCHTRSFVCEKVPAAIHATADLTAKAITKPIQCGARHAGHLGGFLRSQGLRNEHVTAIAGAAGGVLATAVLIKALGPGKQSRNKEAAPVVHDVHEIEIMGGDEELPEEEGAVEIILNRTGVFRRSGPEEPALMVAWPI